MSCVFKSKSAPSCGDKSSTTFSNEPVVSISFIAFTKDVLSVVDKVAKSPP